METRARDVISGTLRPNDPRRFLVEAMIGAMNADGAVDQREREVLDRYLSSHEMFAGMTPANRKVLLELATDAVAFAGSATARVGAIARGLPARLHRITAMAMACEVCVADQLIHEGELTFLEQLRLALRIAPYEAQDIFAAAQGQRTAAYIDDRLLRLRSLVGVAVELFTVRAVTLGKLVDDHRFELRDFLGAIPDLALRQHELEGLLYQAFRKPRLTGPDSELVALAAGLPDAVDRYWMVVYAMCAEPLADLPRWRVIPFVALLQRSFGLGDADMELAAADAGTFPANLPRPA
ncbi:MAG: TerB family tellurite resistance protein [Kofleriaceae bacterium]